MDEKLIVLNDQGGGVMDVSDKAGTLRAQEHGHQPIVCYTVDCRNLNLNEEKSGTLQSKNQGGHSLNFTNPVLIINSSGGGIATTLDSNYYKGQCEREGIEREFVLIPNDKWYCAGNGQLHQMSMLTVTNTLDCMHDQQIILGVGNALDERKYVLRRLTPTECARLQGFPDWWTDGAEGSDSAIYKMWGNGIALPCAADVIGRLAKELEKQL